VNARAAIAALCALLAFACARDLKAGDPPGQRCEADGDCNEHADATATCGRLRLCIAGRCEHMPDAGGSHLVVCPPDAGED
jgi:hypothetical protein